RRSSRRGRRAAHPLPQSRTARRGAKEIGAAVARMSAATCGAGPTYRSVGIESPVQACGEGFPRMSLRSCGLHVFGPLAVAARILAHVAGPVRRQQALTHVQVKRRMRPIAHAGHKVMLDRIEMNVINMP